MTQRGHGPRDRAEHLLTPLLRYNNIFLEKSFVLYEILKFFKGLQVFFWTLPCEPRTDKQRKCDCTALLGARDTKTKALSSMKPINLEKIGARGEEPLE